MTPRRAPLILATEDELTEELDEILDQVAQGCRFVITRRGTPIAEVHPHLTDTSSTPLLNVAIGPFEARLVSDTELVIVSPPGATVTVNHQNRPTG